ncbi:MAG: lipopolysaccharide assembly protein LapA domain-containing protein [Bacillota bacterium]
MRIVFIVLMILLAFAVAVMAAQNDEIVTVSYLFGQVELNLFTVILGSVFAGILIMVFFGIYRSIHNYVKSGSDRALKRELQQRVKFLEKENKRLEDEVGTLKKERENAAEKAKAELEAERNKLQEELNRQKKERENSAEKEKEELKAEKERLEEQLKKEKEASGSPGEQEDVPQSPKQNKSFWDFLKR